MACPEKEVDFLGTNIEEPMKEVLEALLLETATVAVVHSKYWMEAWTDHMASCTTEDLIVVNSACIVQALSTSVQLEGLVKDLRAKKNDLAKWLEEAVHCGDAVQVVEAKVTEVEKKKLEAKDQLGKANTKVERLKKELYEVECQVAALMR